MLYWDRHGTEAVQRAIEDKERTGQPHVVLYGSSRFVESGLAKKIKQNLENYGYSVTRRYPNKPGAERDVSVAKNITSWDVVLAGVDIEMFGDNNIRYNEWLKTHPRVGYFTFQPYVKPSDWGLFSAWTEIDFANMVSEDEDRVAAYIAYKFDIMCQWWWIDSVKRKISGQLTTTLNVPSRITSMAWSETTIPAVSPPPLQQPESKELSYEDAAALLINIMKTAPQITCFFLKQVPELYNAISKDMEWFKRSFLLQYGIELEIEFAPALNFKDPPEKGSFVIKNIQAKAFDNPVVGTVCRVWLMRAMENLLKWFEKKIAVEVPAALTMMINIMLLTRQLHRKWSELLYKSFNHVDANIVWVEEPEFTPAFIQSIYNEQTYPEVMPLVERIYQCYQEEQKRLEKARQVDSPLINEAIELIDECAVSVIFVDDEMLAAPGFMKLVTHTNTLEWSEKRIHFIPLTDVDGITKIQRIAWLWSQAIFPTTKPENIWEIFGTWRFTTQIRNTFSPNETIAIISSPTPRAQMIASAYDKSLTIPKVSKGVVSKRNSLWLPH